MKQTNISVFIPHSGCKNSCSFCNQRIISGQTDPVTVRELNELLLSQADVLEKAEKTAQIAFFGGSFTAIDRGYMESLLCCAANFVEKYPQYTGIRCSTRPDCIDEGVLDLLKTYGMTAIELGAQSMNDGVLKANNRGHTARDVENASAMIKRYGFELGLQMMTGLYTDRPEYCLQTADKFIELGCDTVRIYPTVILKGTELDRLMNSGEYTTFDFEQTVELCSKLLSGFSDAGIPVIRLGLHASREVERDMTGGVYHPAFREICESRIFRDKAERLTAGGGKFVFYTDKRNISKITGQNSCNREYLAQRGVTFVIKREDGTQLRVERIG